MTEKAVSTQVEQPLELSVDAIKGQVNLIQTVMREVMQVGHHYGVIPGTDKPTLLKPGAEKLGLTFRLAPEFIEQVVGLGGDHREYRYKCSLRHIVTGVIVGEGVGSCSTKESKYRWRQQKQKCPACGMEAIIKGKDEYGGGWLCWKKQEGCGAKYADDDARITDQPVGRVENPDIADVYNTVQKMGKKRSHVDAMLTATAASDIFTQDLEEIHQPEPVKDVTPEGDKKAEDIRTALLIYVDEQKMLGHMTGKQRDDAQAYIVDQPSDEDRLSEVAAMYADKCGEFDEGEVKQDTGPTTEIADKAFDDDIPEPRAVQEEIF